MGETVRQASARSPWRTHRDRTDELLLKSIDANSSTGYYVNQLTL